MKDSELPNPTYGEVPSRRERSHHRLQPTHALRRFSVCPIGVNAQPGNGHREGQSTNGKNGKRHRFPPYQGSGPETFPFLFSNSNLPESAAISLCGRPDSNRTHNVGASAYLPRPHAYCVVKQ